MAAYKAQSYDKEYNGILNQQKKAINANYKKAVNGLTAQQEDLKDTYDGARADSYIQAKLNARGANEQTAAMGLQRGTGAATSGYADVQRTAQNNALQSGINRLNTAQQTERDALQRQIIEAGYTRDADTAQAIADIGLKKLGTKQSERQYAASADQAQQGTEYTRALQRAKILGYVATDADAKLLGVPKGTKLK